MTLLVIYFWTIIAGCVAGPTLSLLGTHLATRDRSMQTLCVGQGAMVGVLLGMGLLHDHEVLSSVGPFLSAFLCSGLTYLATDTLVAKKVASKNTFFGFVFALLLAAGYLVSSLFPALESHMAQVYFGDLATLTTFNSKVTIAVSLTCLSALLVFGRMISNQSFEWAVFGEVTTSKNGRFGLLFFKVLTLCMLCLSVQLVGFLFTISMLFLPTAMMNFVAKKGLTLHFSLCALISVIGTLIGFGLSLHFTRLPTVPAIVGIMFVVSMAILFAEKGLALLMNLRKVSENLLSVETSAAQ
jgi:zinc/manganese transport system permease protein/iron/zinc/copper transport system permease protein